MPRRFAKKYSSCLKGWPPTKEVMKEERREEEQEGIEMEGEVVPVCESKEARKGLTAARRKK